MTNIQDIIVNRHPEKSKYTSIKRENLWNSYYDHAQQFKEIYYKTSKREKFQLRNKNYERYK